MANHALRMCHVLETRSLAMSVQRHAMRHERSSVQARPTPDRERGGPDSGAPPRRRGNPAVGRCAACELAPRRRRRGRPPGLLGATRTPRRSSSDATGARFLLDFYLGRVSAFTTHRSSYPMVFQQSAPRTPAVTDHRRTRRDAPRTDRFGFVVVLSRRESGTARFQRGSTRPARRNSELYSVGQSVGLDPERRGVCNPPRPAGRAPGSTRARPAGPPIWCGNVCTSVRQCAAGPRAGPRG